MTFKGVTILAVALLGSIAWPAFGQSSKDWVDVKDAKELRAIYSNKTFRGKGPWGDPIVAHYRADGKGILIIGKAEPIPRTWEVMGTQVCITDPKATSCFNPQRHSKNRNDIVAQHATAGWISQFTIEDGVPQFLLQPRFICAT